MILLRCLSATANQQSTKNKMAILWWTALKRSLSCKSQASCDVIKRDDDDGSRGGSARAFSHKQKPSSSFRLQPSSPSMPRSGCSRSISNLRDVIHSARFQAPPPPAAARGSPMSVESGDVLNAVTRHDVLLATGSSGRVGAGAGPGLAAWDIGAVLPFAHSPFLTRSATANGGARLSQMKSPLRLGAGGVYGDAGSPLPAWASCGEVAVRCNRCDGLFPNDSALESHHLVHHAVTEVADGETASKVVSLIYSAGWPNPEAALDRVDRIVKVHAMETRVDRFREYTEEVKGRAARLPTSSGGKHHPRCVADGNELLRFHGATVACSLGAGGSRSVCASSLCGVCRIIRHGFSRDGGGGVGVLTTSTSRHALDCLRETGGGGGEDGPGGGVCVKRALFLCRVIAGRIHRPLEKVGQDVDVAVQPGFDSVAGKVGDDSSVEELYLLNPSALLPCFVVICKA